VLKGCKARLGADHPGTLTTKNGLANLYRARGQYGQAEALYREVLKGRTARLEADHPDTLTTKGNLAALYQARGQYAQAETLFKEVLAGFTARLGADHPHTLSSKNNLAVLYWRMKKLDRSVALFEELLEQKKRNLGPGHPGTLQELANLGVNYRDAGRLAEGIRCLEEALAGVRKTPVPLPRQLAWIPGELAQTYDRVKQHAKAEAVCREFLPQFRRQLGTDNPRTLTLMAQLGESLVAQEKHAEAEPLLRDCLAIRQKKQPDGWATFSTRSALGGALLGQKKYAGAEPLLKDGYAGLKQRQGKIPEPFRQARLTAALDRLVALYEATGNQEEAARWRKEREAMKRPPAPQP
jgi:tetratricopeptide (TPR) repeat protein